MHSGRRGVALGVVTLAAVALSVVGTGVARADDGAGSPSASAGAEVSREYGISRLASNLSLERAVGQVDGGAGQGEQKEQGEKKEGEEEGGEEAGKKPHAGWEFAVTPYFWAAGVGGDVGVRNRIVSVDAPFSDIIKHFDGGAAFAAEARKGRLGILTDLFWIRLHHSAEPHDILFESANLRLNELMLEGALAYRVTPPGPVAVDLLAGARFWDFNADLSLTNEFGVEHDRSRGVSWVDPIVGGRARAQLNRKLAIFTEGDYGGFGWTSQSTWQFLGGLALRTGRAQELKAGYRLLSIDHRENDFLMDVTASGPILGYTFGFK